MNYGDRPVKCIKEGMKDRMKPDEEVTVNAWSRVNQNQAFKNTMKTTQVIERIPLHPSLLASPGRAKV